MTFVTPWGLLFAVSALLPLAGFAGLEWRARRLRRAVGEPRPRVRSLVPVVASLTAVPALLALAAAQPIVERSKRHVDRADVQVYAVLDTSGSMQASAAPGSPSRLERAKAEALALRRRLSDVRFGVASLTDRTLPHLFPSGDLSVFAATLEQSVGIERPPPSIATLRATSLASLGSLAVRGFFAAPRRVAVVFTDGEADQVTAQAATDLRRAGIRLVFVQVWAPRERIYVGSVPDPNYRPEGTSGTTLKQAAALTHGKAVGEGDLSRLLAATRADLGGGGRTETLEQHDLRQVPLAKWFVLGAAFPLAFLLWHRNLAPAALLRRRRPPASAERAPVV
jgi:hypothetical protein